MNLQVDYIDSAGHHMDLSFGIRRLVFIKHMAMAGQGFAFNPRKLFRGLGMLLHFSQYLERNDFYNNNRFSFPARHLSDPTEKGQFSNLVGKAVADYLSRRVNGSFFTMYYEAAMRVRGIRIKGPRPDLIAFNQKSLFAIEAKGRASQNAGNMPRHKAQAAIGHIPVNFSVASVCFNLYRRIACNYHDPYNEDVRYDDSLLRQLSKDYYEGFTGFLDQRNFRWRLVEVGEERFYEVDLWYNTFNRLLKGEDLRRIFWWEPFGDRFSIGLILPGDVAIFASEGISRELKPFTPLEESDRYIDTDRIGLFIRPSPF